MDLRTALGILWVEVKANPGAYAVLGTWSLGLGLSAWALLLGGGVVMAWVGGVLLGGTSVGYVLGALLLHTDLLTPDEPGDEATNPPPSDHANASTEDPSP